MATQLKKQVCTAGGYDYTALETCMNANEQNLVTADKYFDVEIIGNNSGADTTACVIHNYTTDETRYINVYTTGAARHLGIFSTSYYRLSTGASRGIFIYAHHLTIDGLQITTTSADAIRSDDYYHNFVIKNNILKGTSGGGSGLIISQPRGTNYIYNNISYNWTADYARGLSPAGGGGDDSTNVYVYNNTCYNCYVPLDANSTCLAFVLSNNLALKHTGGTGEGTIYRPDYAESGSNNASSDDKADDSPLTSGLINYTTYADYFVDVTATSEDLHLKTASPFIDAGANLSAVVTVDIDGTARSAPLDIGADEYFAPTNFSRGDYAALPSTEADLENIYTSGEISQVASDNADRVSQSAIAQYAIHQYKTDVGVNTSWTFHWNGQSSLAPSTSVVKLQIYDIEGTTWEDLDEDNAAAANTDFDLTATVTSDLDHYKDVNNVVTCRVYQQWHE